MDTIFNVLSGWRKVGSPGAYYVLGALPFRRPSLVGRLDPRDRFREGSGVRRLGSSILSICEDADSAPRSGQAPRARMSHRWSSFARRTIQSKTAHHTAKCNVPLSISWHEIKHRAAKNYRTHDHKQPEKRPTDASSSRPRQPEKHILAKQHEIKQFVAKKILWNLRHFCRFRHSVA